MNLNQKTYKKVRYDKGCKLDYAATQLQISDYLFYPNDDLFAEQPFARNSITN